MKVEITEPQLRAIVDIANTISSLIGSFDDDFNKEQNKNILLVDRFLKKNGYKRKFN